MKYKPHTKRKKTTTTTTHTQKRGKQGRMTTDVLNVGGADFGDAVTSLDPSLAGSAIGLRLHNIHLVVWMAEMMFPRRESE